MRLVLAEDHALLRAGLTRLLEASGSEILHSLASAAALAARVEHLNAIFATLDLPACHGHRRVQAVLAWLRLSDGPA